VEVDLASPLASSQRISEQEHQLLLITGARLVQWADDLAHRAGNRFQPGRIRWNRTVTDDPVQTLCALEILLTETEQELGYLRQTLNGVRDGRNARANW